MPEYLAPGVYVEEISFRAKPIAGVSTDAVVVKSVGIFVMHIVHKGNGKTRKFQWLL